MCIQHYSLYFCIMEQLNIITMEAIQLSDTRHVLVSVHVTGGVVTSAALHACA